MDNRSQEIITKLKTFKQQGLTFYQASEKLKQAGYTPAQITDAESKVNYVDVKVEESLEPVVKTPPSPKTGSELDRDYQKLGNAVLADKERSARAYAYVGLAIPAFYFGQQVYRFWLNRKFWGSHGDPRYLWANNVGWLLLSGAICAAIAIFSLKVYFRSKDKKYKAIDKQLSDGFKSTPDE